jgi:hypothetical protein
MIMRRLVSRLWGHIRDIRYAVFYSLIGKLDRKTVTLGQECKWTIEDGSIDRRSIVHSAGVGNDVSFEREIAAQFGCKVFLFDPSPTGAATMARNENRQPELYFEQIGLADADGDLFFDSPVSPEGGSYRKTSRPTAASHVFRCLSLPTIMRLRGTTMSTC